MILTLDVPKKLQQQLEREKKKTGLSKSYIVRQILLRHYAINRQKQAAAVVTLPSS